MRGEAGDCWLQQLPHVRGNAPGLEDSSEAFISLQMGCCSSAELLAAEHCLTRTTAVTREQKMKRSTEVKLEANGSVIVFL